MCITSGKYLLSSHRVTKKNVSIYSTTHTLVFREFWKIRSRSAPVLMNTKESYTGVIAGPLQQISENDCSHAKCANQPFKRVRRGWDYIHHMQYRGGAAALQAVITQLRIKVHDDLMSSSFKTNREMTILFDWKYTNEELFYTPMSSKILYKLGCM